MAENLRIAYIISAYKLPLNIISLVNSLNSQGTHFVIHIDKKTTTKVYKEITSNLGGHSNVHFLRRHKSNYRGFGHVQSSLKALQYLHNNKIKYDYTFLLTGQDYPIKSNNYIQYFLRKNYGKSFVEYFSLPSSNWLNGGMDRLNRYYVHFRKGYKSISRRKLMGFVPNNLPKDLKPYGGSSFWTLFSKHSEYVLKFIENNKDFIRFFKHVDIPDEIFFQTILLNSRYKNLIINDDIRYIDWSNPKECPAIIRASDFTKLKSSKDLFARKFDMSVDTAIIQKIDGELRI